MRDERGDILPNAHTIGFLRRICKLLYLNIRPVFVFDGSTPILKKKTVAERRRRREQQDARVRKTAEKLLLNRLKQYAVREVEKAKVASIASETKKTPDESQAKNSCDQPSNDIKDNEQKEDAVHVLEGKDLVENKSEDKISSDESEDDLEGFEVDVESGVDPEVLSTLPPSMQLEIMLQLREKAMAAARGGFESRCKKPEEFSQYQIQQYLNSTGLRRKLDAIRGVAQQNSDISKPVAGEQDKHYVLYREDQNNDLKSQDHIEDTICTSAEPKALNISFCVNDDELDFDDMPWEDVQEEIDEPKHHSEKKSKYWSLSHGFQKGRSLGNWGEQPSTSAIEATPKATAEEQAMIDEAIKRSLVEHTDLEGHYCTNDTTNVETPVHSPDKIESPKIEKPGPDKETERSKLVQHQASELAQHGNDNENVVEKSCEIVKRDEPCLTRDMPGKQSTNVVNDSGIAPKGPAKLEIRGNDCSSDIERKIVTSSSDNNTTLMKKLERNNKQIATDIQVPLDLADTSELSKVEDTILEEPQSAPATVEDANVINDIQEPRLDGKEVEALLAQSTSEMFDLEQLAREESILRSDRRAATGQSDSPTEQMFTECQELLQMFGIPYIVAPTEAEAQCAWLDANNLVDGVVTDDNDAFLFGAKRVYRHIFEESKYVEEYRTEDVERELGLSRESLILMALLLGSDYTPGIAGVGVVNAVEIISAFVGFEGLEDFKNWVNAVDDDIVALIREDEAKEEKQRPVTKEFKQKHKTIRKSWVLPEDFPSQEVVESYQKPALDDSKSKFTFISPDFPMLESFCSRKFGWDDGKIRDLFEPVKKSLSQRDKQQTIQGFLSFREKFARVRSKRLAQAVEKVKKKNLKRDT